MKITTRCGDAAVAGLNEALLAKAAAAKLLRPTRSVPTRPWSRPMSLIRPIRGCWPRRSARLPARCERVKAAGGATRTRSRDRRRAAGRRARSIASKLRLRGAQQRVEAQATVRRITGELADLADWPGSTTRTRWCGTLAGRCAGPPGRRGRPRAGCIARWTS